LCLTLTLTWNLGQVILEALAYNETLVSLTVLGEEGSFMNLNFSPNFTDKEAGWLADALRCVLLSSDVCERARVYSVDPSCLVWRVCTQGQHEPHERGSERQ
jgi:hypothetical protein